MKASISAKQNQNTIRQKNAILEDPLYEPLRKIGVDGPGIRRILKGYSRGVIQRWIRITDAAMDEKPRGFTGFRASPAAFLIDGIQHNRTPPDWMHAHEKRLQKQEWEHERATATQDDSALRTLYERERAAALEIYLASSEGREKYEKAYPPLLAFHKLMDPRCPEQAARKAVLDRIARLDFQFPEYETWVLASRQPNT